MKELTFDNSKNNSRLAEIEEMESKLYPEEKLKIIAQILGYSLLLLLIKGGNTYQSIIGL